MSARRPKRTYDHRLVRLVQETGDVTVATSLGVPRSTAAGWVRRARTTVITAPAVETASAELLARVAWLEARVRRLMAVLRILLAVFRVVRPDLTLLRVPDGRDKARLLRAIE